MKVMKGRFIAELAGTTAVEYALIAAAIVLIIAITLPFIGNQVGTMFQSVAGAFTN